MILIFGGAYQGKLEYAKKQYRISENAIYKCVKEIIYGKMLYYDFHKWIYNISQKENMDELLQDFLNNNPDAIIICEDISCGVVPVDEDLRKWREDCGRSLGIISQRADVVIRLFCGIPTVLKPL
ncbi:MAG: bifunctional adenosylcobinamide kinase/adenosylcobinamide-phosphate guanylyltransferase [Lachnospirales bacterium]